MTDTPVFTTTKWLPALGKLLDGSARHAASLQFVRKADRTAEFKTSTTVRGPASRTYQITRAQAKDLIEVLKDFVEETPVDGFVVMAAIQAEMEFAGVPAFKSVATDDHVGAPIRCFQHAVNYGAKRLREALDGEEMLKVVDAAEHLLDKKTVHETGTALVADIVKTALIRRKVFPPAA